MNKYKVAVLSCVRNAEIHIEESLHYIFEFKNLFKQVSFFAAENDSKDNSYGLGITLKLTLIFILSHVSKESP